jgi:hypothetical protein
VFKWATVASEIVQQAEDKCFRDSMFDVRLRCK